MILIYVIACENWILVHVKLPIYKEEALNWFAVYLYRN